MRSCRLSYETVWFRVFFLPLDWMFKYKRLLFCLLSSLCIQKWFQPTRLAEKYIIPAHILTTNCTGSHLCFASATALRNFQLCLLILHHQSHYSLQPLQYVEVSETSLLATSTVLHTTSTYSPIYRLLLDGFLLFCNFFAKLMLITLYTQCLKNNPFRVVSIGT